LWIKVTYVEMTVQLASPLFPPLAAQPVAVFTGAGLTLDWEPKEKMSVSYRVHIHMYSMYWALVVGQ
jgi:hypothetical protein